MNTHIIRYVWLALAVVLFSGAAAAASVSARLSGNEAYVGMPIALYVTIENAAAHQAPTIPPIDGVRVRAAGTPSRSSQVTIVNGRRSESNTLTYAFELTPLRDGTFTVPALSVEADGRAFATRPLTFAAQTSEVGDTLFVEVVGQQDRVYVGEALPLSLRVWIKPYMDAELGIGLSESDMWSLVSDRSSWGPFTEALQALAAQRQRPVGREVTRPDEDGVEQRYYLYEIEHEIYPDRPGAIEGGDVSVVLAYPTGLKTSRDFFGRSGVNLAGVRPVVVTSGVEGVTAQPIPTADRPDTFKGAVGRYLVAAEATPKQISAGDPITLRIGVKGDGRMDLLQAPPLSRVDALTGDFRVPDDALAGVVRDDVKLFTTSIRPLREGVAEIPPIPFSYFDPEQERFVTVYTEPIPIEVTAARALDMSSIVSAQRPAAPRRDQDDAGATDEPVLLHANFALSADQLERRSGAGAWTAAALAVGPAVFLLTLIVRRLTHGANDPARSAGREAVAALSRAADTAAIKSALMTYCAQRFALPIGMTRNEAVAALGKRTAPMIVEDCNEVLLRCETTQYAPSGAVNIQELAAKAAACVEEMERAK